MKNILLFIALALIIGGTLHSESYHFVANDPYYKQPVKIDSINVYYMNTGKDTTFVSSSVHLDAVTTVELNNDYSDIRLFPNPTNDILNIEFVSNNIASTPITIVDLEGRKLYAQNEYLGIGKQNLSLNIAGLDQGIYFVLIGQSTHKFAKMGSSNGADILLSQSSLPTLIKENSTQSQYDYKFTIYSQGFVPKYYYSKQAERETIIVELSSLPTGFNGKHIRVELYISGLQLNYLNVQHNWHNITDTVYKEYNNVYLDTLVIRNNKVNLLKNYELRNKRWADESYDLHKIRFEFDTINKTISKLEFNYEFEFWDESGDEFRVNKIDSRIKIDKKMSYNLANGLSLFVFLDEVNPEYYYKESKYRSYSCPGHTEYWDIMSFNPSKSYIKIEIID